MSGALVVFGLDEVLEHVFVPPASVPHGLPLVEVPPVASHVQEPVDGRGAAQGLAGRDLERLKESYIQKRFEFLTNFLFICTF